MNYLKNKFNTITVSTNFILFLMRILKFKDFFISLVFCFLVFLIIFVNYNIFFVFCDTECHLVVEVNQLNSDKILTQDTHLIEKLKNFEDKLKECQKRTEELQVVSKQTTSLGGYLVGVVVLIAILEFYIKKF
jgi:type II secretory pathway component PulC